MTEAYHWWETDQFAAVALLLGGVLTGALLLIVINWAMQAPHTIDINWAVVLAVALGTFLTGRLAARE